MNVGKIWSFLAEKFRRSDNSLLNRAHYKEAPPIPAHKARTQGGYSIVVIGRSGASRQYDVSTGSSRLVIGVAAITLVFSAIGLFNVVKVLFIGTSTAQESAISEKLTALQDELRNKEVALAVQESRLKEQNSAGAEGRAPRDFEQASGASDSRSSSTFQSSLDSSGASVSPNEKLEGSFDSSLSESDTRSDKKTSTGPQKSESSVKTARIPQEKAPGLDVAPQAGSIVNFNTQDVAIAAESPGTGTLSFRLVKDHPNVLFSGYLFVFVEMEDKRGENKIYVYPDKTRLGEGDLPSDFKEGESISFKYNSRVELPFGDIRTGATLARVSILLYGDNGKIVFQRGFEKKELNIATANSNKPDSTRQKTASEKRRPL